MELDVGVHTYELSFHPQKYQTQSPYTKNSPFSQVIFPLSIECTLYQFR